MATTVPQYRSIRELKYSTNPQYEGAGGDIAKDALKYGAMGASIGAAVGGGILSVPAAVIGGAIGTIAGGIAGFVKGKKKHDSKAAADAAIKNAEYGSYSSSMGKTMNAKGEELNVTAMGGNMEENMGESTGAEFQEISSGGTHEQNPNGGVFAGVGDNGKPNTLEEGEVKYGKFAYSARVEFETDPSMPSFVKGDTYAEAAKSINKRFKDRSDGYSRATEKDLYLRLAAKMEATKARASQKTKNKWEQAPEMPDINMSPDGGFLSKFRQKRLNSMYTSLSEEAGAIDTGIIQGSRLLDRYNRVQGRSTATVDASGNYNRYVAQEAGAELKDSETGNIGTDGFTEGDEFKMRGKSAKFADNDMKKAVLGEVEEDTKGDKLIAAGLGMQTAGVIGSVAGLASLSKPSPVKAFTVSKDEYQANLVDREGIRTELKNQTSTTIANLAAKSGGDFGALASTSESITNRSNSALSQAMISAEELDAAELARVQEGRMAADMFNSEQKAAAADATARDAAAHRAERNAMIEGIVGNLASLGTTAVNSGLASKADI